MGAGVMIVRGGVAILCAVTVPLSLGAPASFASVAAAPPRVFLDTRYVAPSGATITVRGGEDLQGVLDRAQPGDEVVLEAGATFTGNFVLPAKAGGGVI